MSLADKFTEALNADASGTNLSEGVDAASGPSIVLLPSGPSASSIMGILAFCLGQILGGNCCGGLVQGSVAAFGTRMCVEVILLVKAIAR
jgi:hypothetical protein